MSQSKHGMYRTPTYNSWANMRARCNNPNSTFFPNYGGRGIKCCPEWSDFAQFYADMGQRPEGKTLDRIDNERGYCVENCRWASRKEQANNMRKNVLYEGKTVKQICEERGLSHQRVYDRLHKGWSIEDALTRPRCCRARQVNATSSQQVSE